MTHIEGEIPRGIGGRKSNPVEYVEYDALIGYESLFHTFLKSLPSDTVKYLSTIGVAGYISVSGDVIDE